MKGGAVGAEPCRTEGAGAVHTVRLRLQFIYRSYNRTVTCKYLTFNPIQPICCDENHNRTV